MKAILILALLLSTAACGRETNAPWGTVFPGNPPFNGPYNELITDGNGFAMYALKTGAYTVDYAGNYNTGASFTFYSRSGTPERPGRMLLTNLVNGGLVDTNELAPSSDIDLVYLSKGAQHVVGVQGEYHGQPSAMISWPQVSLGRSTNLWAEIWLAETPCPAVVIRWLGTSTCVKVNGGAMPIYR